MRVADTDTSPQQAAVELDTRTVKDAKMIGRAMEVFLPMMLWMGDVKHDTMTLSMTIMLKCSKRPHHPQERMGSLFFFNHK